MFGAQAATQNPPALGAAPPLGGSTPSLFGSTPSLFPATSTPAAPSAPSLFQQPQQPSTLFQPLAGPQPTPLALQQPPPQQQQPVTTLDTPYEALPEDHKRFLAQLDELIDKTSQFNKGLLPAQGMDLASVKAIGTSAEATRKRLTRAAAALAGDEVVAQRFKAQVDKVVREARDAHEAFDRRAEYAVRPGDGAASMTFGFFQERLEDMRGRTATIATQLKDVEALVSSAEACRTAPGQGAGRPPVQELRDVVVDHQALIEALAARVAAVHSGVGALRRVHATRLGRDPFKEEEEKETVAKHLHTSVPRARLARWRQTMAPPQPVASQAPQGSAPPQGLAAPQTSAPPQAPLFGQPTGAPGLGPAVTAAQNPAAPPSLFGPPSATPQAAAAMPPMLTGQPSFGGPLAAPALRGSSAAGRKKSGGRR